MTTVAETVRCTGLLTEEVIVSDYIVSNIRDQIGPGHPA